MFHLDLEDQRQFMDEPLSLVAYKQNTNSKSVYGGIIKIRIYII
jgi:hypothetical protein